jgi:acetoacetyl-CoA synthetase
VNDTTPIWQPTAARVADANLTRFHAFARERGAPGGDYASLWQWTVDSSPEFWRALMDFCEVVADRGDGAVLRNGDRMPGAKWFADARINFAENLLRGRGDDAAVVGWDERGRRGALTWNELHAEVARVADGLRAAGVTVGDRVAGFLPNVPATVVAMLATTSLGATWSSCSPDFGIRGVLDRFGQIEPKVLFTADGYFYAGKTIDSLGRIAGLLDQLPSVTQVVVVPNVVERPDIARVPRSTHYKDFGRSGASLSFTRVPFDQPLYILYSSGTTGTPKCIVHGVGGTLLQHLKEHQLHCDIKPGDRLFFYTTCGWMMWNWLASALASQATIVLYDGSPMHPDDSILWQLAETEGVAFFGTSPKYLATLEKNGFRPRERARVPKLRMLISTGSPLAPEQFDFVAEAIGKDVQLASISGGTDIVSCFALGSPTLPVYRGELQCRGLGMRVEVYDDEGRPLVGQQGELVCTSPFPSMPVGFWNDPDGSRYRAAYFERFPNIWCHGDYAVLTERGGIVILGRSDAVLNPGGVRIGTAEIYRQVEKLPEVLESVAIGQEWNNDVRVVLFVRLAPGAALDAAMEKRIRDVIRQNATPRHVPARIVSVPEIPRTISGKIVELAVREVVHGRPVKNTDALANPAALEHFRDRSELRD